MTSESSFLLSTPFASGGLAFMLGLHWHRNGTHGGIGYWTIAAALFSASNFGLFAGHQMSSSAVSLTARVLLTIAHGALFLGAQGATGRKPSLLAVVGALALTGVISATLLGRPELYYGRVTLSRLTWGACCLLAYRVLRQADPHFWQGAVAPARLLLYQGLYMVVRSGMVLGMWLTTGTADSPTLFALDYSLAVLFDVTLFVSLLMTHHHIRSDELASTRIELQTVSGLLPVCAWCKKVRDDDGYWHEVETYLKKQAAGKITHGMCQPCSVRLHASIDAS